jgi:hypothetical protein
LLFSLGALFQAFFYKRRTSPKSLKAPKFFPICALLLAVVCSVCTGERRKESRGRSKDGEESQNGHTNNITQHNTTQHNTTQHNTTQHNTTQHNIPYDSFPLPTRQFWVGPDCKFSFLPTGEPNMELESLGYGRMW